MNIKQMPEEFRKNNLIYRLIKRTAHLALYGVFNKKGIQYSYEVHKVRILSTPHHWKGFIEPTYERLASNEEFGKYGWSFTSLEAAEKKLRELEKLIKKKE